MNNQKGISLITLVVTMIVMIILIGVVGSYSLENIKKSGDAVSAAEFASVRDFTLKMQTKILAEDHKIDTSKIGLSNDLLYLLVGESLSNTDLNNIVDVNSSDVPAECKYYYIPADEKLFEDKDFTKGNITVQDVKNDYIINFYTATVICIQNDSCKVDGLIKGLSEIVLLIGE
ncbi:MAG: type II secretion system protein [Clostridia bacterium]|nr:type II secretion system protein [Clostridia bacterium]